MPPSYPGFRLRNASDMVAKYMSEGGTELGAGQTGEIWLKGPNVTRRTLPRGQHIVSSFSLSSTYRNTEIMEEGVITTVDSFHHA